MAAWLADRGRRRRPRRSCRSRRRRRILPDPLSNSYSTVLQCTLSSASTCLVNRGQGRYGARLLRVASRRVVVNRVSSDGDCVVLLPSMFAGDSMPFRGTSGSLTSRLLRNRERLGTLPRRCAHGRYRACDVLRTQRYSDRDVKHISCHGNLANCACWGDGDTTCEKKEETCLKFSSDRKAVSADKGGKLPPTCNKMSRSARLTAAQQRGQEGDGRFVCLHKK